MITREEIISRLAYKPDGRFYWKVRPRSQFSCDKGWKIFNSKFAGKEAGTETANGYLQVRIMGKVVLMHRLAWCIHNEWPENGMDIDHINGNKKDNRIKNLRCVSRSANIKNSRMWGTNTSGVTGVGMDKAKGMWFARVQIDGKSKFLGYREDFFEAVCLRKSHEAINGYHLNHGRAR